MSNRRKPNKYRDGIQLNLFIEPSRPNSPLYSLIEEHADIEKLIGSNEAWLEKTLSDVLCQWDYLYDTYVANFDDAIQEARKAKGKSSELELLQLKQALRLSIITNLYVERMAYFEALVTDKAKNLGVEDDDISYVNDLIHSFFHQPQHTELGVTLEAIVPVLAGELVI